MNLLTKQKQAHKLSVVGGNFNPGKGQFGSLEWTRTHCYNRVLLYSTGNSAQCYVAAWMGAEFGGEWTHVYVWLSPFAVHLKLSQCC